MFPIGGYVKLKGEEALVEAHSERKRTMTHIPNGFFGVSAWKRIVIASGGPIFNILAAVIIFSAIFTIGYNVSTYGNRIVLTSDFDQNQYAADKAGLESGDRIISTNDVDTDYFFQIREQIIDANNEEIEMVIDRNGKRIAIRAQGELDPNSGATILGIYPWIDPVIDSVVVGGPADTAGLQRGDVITAIDGQPVAHSIDVDRLIRLNSTTTVTVLRDGNEKMVRIPVGEEQNGNPEIGIGFSTVIARTADLNIAQAMAQSITETGRIFRLTVRGISLIFSGMRVTNVVAGPIQLTSIIGEVAKSGSEQGFWAVMRLFFYFLAIINVALCFMNILPIPILDGGQILLYGWEAVRRKALRPRTIVRYQQVGSVCVLLLLILALTSDFLFLFN